MSNRVFQCNACGHQWEVPPCTAGGKHGYEISCPKCGGVSKTKIEPDGTRHLCEGGAHRHSHQHHGPRHGGCCGGHK